MTALRERGVLAALGAACLFGAGTPAAKLLLGPVDPWLLAALLYLGSGLGLGLLWLLRRGHESNLRRGDIGWLAGAVAAGGFLAPVLLMWGLDGMPASSVSLLLNAEGVFTALLAWFAFHENFDRRIAAGMLLIVAGAALLSWPREMEWYAALPSLAVIGACFAWAVDNNLTRKIALGDPLFIAMVKGLAAGTINLVLALAGGAHWPSLPVAALAGLLGFASYGVSLAMFVVALRELGTARTGAYFSTAPFVGAVIALLLLGEPLSVALIAAALLIGAGVWLHLTERHEHVHVHEALEHEHEHTHDLHHDHAHDESVPPGVRHTHRHRHEALTHSHPHYPDAHHTHKHV